MVVLLSTTVQACAPIVAHGPQVQPGLSGGVTIAIGGGPTYENGDDPGPFQVGALVVHGAYGWRPAGGRLPAFQLGAQTSPLGKIGTDVYLQAPPAWLGPAAVGVGLRSDGTVRHMPYLQAGVASHEGLGVHVVLGRYAYRWEAMTHTGDERARIGWLSLQLPFGSRVTTRLHGGYARGHVVKRSTRPTSAPDPYVDEDRWSSLGGVTFELHRPRR